MNRSAENNAQDTYRPLWKAAVGSLMLLLVIAGLKSYRDLSVARSHEQSLQQQIELTRGRIGVLTDRIERIENDEATLEQLAREELGWVRQNDLVIVLPEAADSEPLPEGSGTDDPAAAGSSSEKAPSPP